jgi:hypothetical protein
MTILPKWWRTRFLKVELAAAILLAGCVCLFLFRWWGDPSTWAILKNLRSTTYSTLASIFGSMLGFEITAGAAAFGAMGSDRLKRVRESTAFPQLWRVFTAGIRASALATIAALLGLLIDREAAPMAWLAYLNIFSIILVALRTIRSAWVLTLVVQIVTRP